VWAFLLQQSMGQAQQDLVQAQARIADLERRLSSSDDSWNQSSASISIKIKELVEKNETLWQEMDKLWASAWRRNQKDIGDQAALLKKQDGLLKAQAKMLEDMRKELSGGISNTGKRIEQLEQSTAARQKALDDAMTRFNKVANEQVALGKRVRANEEWIESINTHRKQINQSLDSLRKSVDSMSRPAGTSGFQ
jgi:chromosome segregation ATPase